MSQHIRPNRVIAALAMCLILVSLWRISVVRPTGIDGYEFGDVSREIWGAARTFFWALIAGIVGLPIFASALIVDNSKPLKLAGLGFAALCLAIIVWIAV